MTTKVTKPQWETHMSRNIKHWQWNQPKIEIHTQIQKGFSHV